MIELKGKYNRATVFTYNVDSETVGQIIRILNNKPYRLSVDRNNSVALRAASSLERNLFSKKERLSATYVAVGAATYHQLYRVVTFMQ